MLKIRRWNGGYTLMLVDKLVESYSVTLLQQLVLYRYDLT